MPKVDVKEFAEIMVVLRLTQFVLRIAVSLVLALAVLWAAAALWIDDPESRALAGALAGGLVLIAAVAAVRVRPWWRAGVAIFVPFAIEPRSRRATTVVGNRMSRGYRQQRSMAPC